MIHISELLDLTLFEDFKLIAGSSGINNLLSNIVILEYESYIDSYGVFSRGDLVLSSLFFAKDNPALIEDALLNLIKRDVAGIAIKTVFFNDIPEKIKKIADRKSIPIFLFSDAYMEDLIICANELLQSKSHFIINEEKIAKLLENKNSFHNISETLSSINPYLHPNIITAFFTPQNTDGSKAISYYFKRLLYNQYKFKNNMNFSYVKYRHGMMLIYSSESPISDCKTIIVNQLKSIDLIPNQFYIGICDTIYDHNHFDFSMKQAIYSNRVCQLKKTDCLSFSEIGIYQLILSLSEQPMILEQYNNQINKLKNYDLKFTSNLLSTLIEYVNCNCEISKTASNLFQHPNTIRYRLKKACEILSYNDDNFPNYFYLLINIYLINTYTKI
ncbi:MAG: PucR family transcriptional regulator [Clostridium sp.]